MYSFQGQLNRGENYECVLDEYFSKKLKVEKVSMSAQKSGIDRVFTTCGKSKYRYSVEYKSDELTKKTGNVFIETVSVDKDEKPGWAYSSCAQMLIYYTVGMNKVYAIPMLTLKNLVPLWVEKYEEKPVQNNGYKTYGVAVPLGEFAAVCVEYSGIEDIDGG